MNNPYAKRPYQKDAPPRVGDMCVWGVIDNIDRIDEGVLFVYTPSHGGVWLSDERASEIPDNMVAGNFLKSRKWWEEDCDAIKVLRELGYEE